MKLDVFDHLTAIVIVVVLPILAVRGYKRFIAGVLLDPELRRQQYLNTIVTQWSLVALVLVHWFAVGRDRTALGLVVPIGWPALAGLALSIGVVVMLWRQLVSIREAGEPAIATLRSQLDSVATLLPRTALEARWFRALAITAGICEEVLYRGFLLAYLGTIVGTWPAIAVGATLFGIAHSYQGSVNALKGCVFALLAGALYQLTGSLLWPMIIHVAVDLHGGALGRLVLGDRD